MPMPCEICTAHPPRAGRYIATDPDTDQPVITCALCPLARGWDSILIRSVPALLAEVRALLAVDAMSLRPFKLQQALRAIVGRRASADVRAEVDLADAVATLPRALTYATPIGLARRLDDHAEAIPVIAATGRRDQEPKTLAEAHQLIRDWREVYRLDTSTLRKERDDARAATTAVAELTTQREDAAFVAGYTYGWGPAYTLGDRRRQEHAATECLRAWREQPAAAPDASAAAAATPESAS